MRPLAPFGTGMWDKAGGSAELGNSPAFPFPFSYSFFTPSFEARADDTMLIIESESGWRNRAEMLMDQLSLSKPFLSYYIRKTEANS